MDPDWGEKWAVYEDGSRTGFWSGWRCRERLKVLRSTGQRPISGLSFVQI